jgi:hypothetical protein
MNIGGLPSLASHSKTALRPLRSTGSLTSCCSQGSRGRTLGTWISLVGDPTAARGSRLGHEQDEGRVPHIHRPGCAVALALKLGSLQESIKVAGMIITFAVDEGEGQTSIIRRKRVLTKDRNEPSDTDGQSDIRTELRPHGGVGWNFVTVEILVERGLERAALTR